MARMSYEVAIRLEPKSQTCRTHGITPGVIGAYIAAPLSFMPRNRRKRARSCEVSEVVSAGGVEVVSVDIVAGKTVKKRAFEKVFFEVPAPEDFSPPPPTTTPRMTLPPLPVPKVQAVLPQYVLFSLMSRVSRP